MHRARPTTRDLGAMAPIPQPRGRHVGSDCGDGNATFGDTY